LLEEELIPAMEQFLARIQQVMRRRRLPMRHVDNSVPTA
jgi:hypothetical protein